MTAGSLEARAAFLFRLRERGIRDLAVLRAMEAVPRDAFVPHRYADLAARDIALPLPCGQTLSEPSLVARMLEALGGGARAPRAGGRVGVGLRHRGPGPASAARCWASSASAPSPRPPRRGWRASASPNAVRGLGRRARGAARPRPLRPHPGPRRPAATRGPGGPDELARAARAGRHDRLRDDRVRRATDRARSPAGGGRRGGLDLAPVRRPRGSARSTTARPCCCERASSLRAVYVPGGNGARDSS